MKAASPRSQRVLEFPVKQTWRNLALLHAEAGASCGEKLCLALITNSCDVFTPLRTLLQRSQPNLCFQTPDFYLASPLHPGSASTWLIAGRIGTLRPLGAGDEGLRLKGPYFAAQSRSFMVTRESMLAP